MELGTLDAKITMKFLYPGRPLGAVEKNDTAGQEPKPWTTQEHPRLLSLATPRRTTRPLLPFGRAFKPTVMTLDILLTTMRWTSALSSLTLSLRLRLRLSLALLPSLRLLPPTSLLPRMYNQRSKVLSHLFVRV
jgi:hypothetical protein